MKKKRMIAAGVLMTACLGISGTYAYYQDSVSVQNHISTGDINIGIQEYQEINGKETEYDLAENRIVLPSEVVSKIPRITNYAETCYVRAKVTHHSSPVSDSDTKETAGPSGGNDCVSPVHFTSVLEIAIIIILGSEVIFPVISTQI